ncbi:hypothetical protein F4860DRAFT_128988 [Xylaria cubensis]|nr:hypothetical protein F4860DRAFT_128988 [Xylaria cubensis]
MPEETQLSARQLLRFSQTNHPHLTHIQANDIRFARLLAPTLTEDLIPYPLEWLESLRSFQAFLRGWRQKYAVPAPSTPSLQLPPNPSLTRRQLDESRRRAQRTTDATTGLSTATTLPGDFLPTPYRKPRIGPLRFSPSHSRRNSDPGTPSILRPSLFHPTSSASTDEDQDTPDSGDCQSSHQSSHQSSDSLHSLNLSFSQTLTFPPDSPHTFHPPGYFLHPPRRTSEPDLTPEDTFEPDFTPEDTPELEIPTMASMTPEQIAEIVSWSVAATMEAFKDPARGGGGGGSPALSSDNSKSFKPDDVGYFNLGIKDPEGHGMVASGRLTIYTNVHAFIYRLKHLSSTRLELAVKEVWGLCF